MEKLGPHDLIQSFISGLSDFLSTLGLGGSSADKPTFPLYLYNVGSGATVTWQADRDYFVRNVTFDGATGSNAVVSTDNSTYASIHNTGVQKLGTVIASYQNNVIPFLQKTAIRSGQKIYYQVAAASACACIIYLEAA